MLSYQHLLDVGQAPDVDALQARLAAAVEAMGFGLSGGTLIRGRLSSGKATVHALGVPPAGFLEASRSLDVGLRDPLLTAMQAEQGCFTYDQAFYVKAGAGDLWDHQAAFGYRHGLAVSLHEFSHVEIFSFGVDGPDALPAAPAARLELEANVRLLALHAHEAAKRLWTPAPAVDLNSVGKPELEALRWAVDATVCHFTRGKVVISHPGRTEAMRSAARKLGATNRVQTVLRAIEGGLIEP